MFFPRPFAPHRSAPLALALIFVSACASSPRVNIDGPALAYKADDYDDVLAKWTRSQQLFSVDEMDTVLTATATFESLDFRSAFVAKYKKEFQLSPTEGTAEIDKARKETKEQHRFFVSLYGGERKYNDLSRANEASWSVRLVDDAGNQVEPL